MKPGLKLLYITDQSSGCAGDTLRGLTDRHGMKIVTLDVRAFSSQNVHDAEGFAELDRRAWLSKYDADAHRRFLWADVLFADSSLFALSWVSRARFNKPLIARLCLEDCERPGVHLVDWTAVRHLVFTDVLSQSAFDKVLPRRVPAERTSVIPLHLADRRFKNAGTGGISVRLAGDAANEAGLATALAMFEALPGRTMTPRLIVDDTPMQGPSVAGRKGELATGRAGARRHDIGMEAGAHSDEAAYGYVMCAAPSLNAAWSVLLHAARGARPLLLKDRTAVQSLLGRQAILFTHPDGAAAAVLHSEAQNNPGDPADRIARLRTLCGVGALDALAHQIRRASRRPGPPPPGIAKVRAWFVKRLTRLNNYAKHAFGGGT